MEHLLVSGVCGTLVGEWRMWQTCLCVRVAYVAHLFVCVAYVAHLFVCVAYVAHLFVYNLHLSLERYLPLYTTLNKQRNRDAHCHHSDNFASIENMN